MKSTEVYTADSIESYDRSDMYWVGWMLTHYQWYSSRSFKSILDTISYNELIGLYKTLHEAESERVTRFLTLIFSKTRVNSKQSGNVAD